jgi:hypothetical protein
MTMTMTMARPRATSRRRLRGPSRRLALGNRPRSGGRQGPRGPIEPGGPAIRGETRGSGGGHPPADQGRRRGERARRRDLLERADGRRRGQERVVARGRVQAGAIRQGRLRTTGRRGPSRRRRLLRGAAAARSSPALRPAMAVSGMRSRVERIDARRPGLAHQNAGQHQHSHRPGPAEGVAREVGDRHSHGGVAAWVSGWVEDAMIEAERPAVKGRGGPSLFASLNKMIQLEKSTGRNPPLSRYTLG